MTIPSKPSFYILLVILSVSAITVMAQSPVTATPPTPIEVTPEALPPDQLTVDAVMAIQQGIYVGQVANPPIQIYDFELPSSNEGIERMSDLDGTWRVIFFGYMHCPDFCPLTLVEYKHVKAHLGDAASEVTFLFISVDGARDTPDLLRRYLDNFDREFIGFVGDDETLSQIQPDYNFYYSRRMAGDSLAVYTIDHSTRSYLVDRDGVLRGSFAYDTDPELIAQALLWYMDHE